MTAQYFVGIGAPRAATSWLGRYLDEHPQVAFSPIKELHYFDARYRPDLCGHFDETMRQGLLKTARAVADSAPGGPSPRLLEKLRCLCLRNEMTNDPGRYPDYFAMLRRPGQRAFGEITPAYCLLDRGGFSAIQDMFPRVKVVYVLRDPVDQYWSALRYRETLGKEPGFSAEDNIARRLSDPQFALRVDYRRTCTELAHVVPEERRLVMFFEHLIDPATSAREIATLTDFLGVDYLPSRLEEKINASVASDLKREDAAHIAARLGPVYDFAIGQFGARLPDRWRERRSLF